MFVSLENFKQKVSKIKDVATEPSFYPSICDFVREFGEEHNQRNVIATPLEKQTEEKKRIGFPDITVRRNGLIVGLIEVKLPKDSLNDDKFKEQFNRYREGNENVLFTNLREWQLWQWEDEKPKKIAEEIFDITSYKIGAEKIIENILIKFFEGSTYTARTPKQLALALAKKTKLLSQQVEEALDDLDEKSDLIKLKKTFEATLIQNISSHQFANMVAETLAYSLFLAALEHTNKNSKDDLDLTTAIKYLPTNVPILKDLYSLVNKISDIIPNIHHATELLLNQLNAADLIRIHQKLVEHKPGEDPVIQFYEPFLNEYDPKEREARGVYYTPKPVVDYIVRGVDYILKEKFGKEKGLADESVYLLDPATGTGTFLMSAIQQIHSDVTKKWKQQGDEMIKQEFNKIVLKHILKHFYGFELLVAPYAIAHLKLTLEIERLGFDFILTKDDKDLENDRFQVFLANTLDDPSKPPQSFFGYDSIPKETEEARKIKNEAPVMVVIGNPPYSSISTNMGPWIKSLVNEYLYVDGIRIEEKSKRNNLQNDYVKFIRFAQWKLSQVKNGVIGMITDNSYLDGRTFRGMRKNLINEFSDIYILNLHGDTKRKEKTDDGMPDKNVFDITQGVAIIFLIKDESSKSKGNIKYCDLFGASKEIKFDWLINHQLKDIEHDLQPKAPNYLFIPTNLFYEDEWDACISLKDIFRSYGTGVKTNRDGFVIDYECQVLMSRMKDFYNKAIGDNEIVSRYSLKENYVWKINKAREKFRANPVSEQNIYDYYYRPFDTRKIYFDKAVVFNPRYIISNQFIKNNIGLMTSGQISTGKFSHAFTTTLIPDICSLSLQTREPLVCMPLYVYYAGKGNLFELAKPDVNLKTEFIDQICSLLNVKYVYLGNKEEHPTIGPEEIYYYIYSILNSPAYRSRYAEQLKNEIPKIPFGSNKTLFYELSKRGNELVNLHLLGENPFDKAKTILDEPQRWDIKPVTEIKQENDWAVLNIRYDKVNKRVYVNPGQYFEGVGPEVWEFMIGGYQVCDTWLKYRKKANRSLSSDDIKHYMKIVVSIRETIRIMKEIDELIDKHGSWPLK